MQEGLIGVKVASVPERTDADRSGASPKRLGKSLLGLLQSSLRALLLGDVYGNADQPRHLPVLIENGQCSALENEASLLLNESPSFPA